MFTSEAYRIHSWPSDSVRFVHVGRTCALELDKATALHAYSSTISAARDDVGQDVEVKIVQSALMSVRYVRP